MTKRILAFTEGDPAGIGPEIVLKALAAREMPADVVPLLVAERVALEQVAPFVEDFAWDRLVDIASPSRAALEGLPEGTIALLDPVRERRAIEPGESTAADARAAMAAIDVALELAQTRVVDAMVTAPVSKKSIARHVRADFVGHTEYLAEKCGLHRYGRDFLMAFLAPDLQVALLSVHEPIARAIEMITPGAVLDALDCLHRHAGGRIALAGLNPHAGEQGLLGTEDEELLRPAVERARRKGIDVHGPESADSLFARACHGEFDWVLALYHDQGLIAVKTAAFGESTNWSLGLPILRTSVDHGTAFKIAGSGVADARPMLAVVETTLELMEGTLPLKNEGRVGATGAERLSG